jgi:pyruvate,water dikinase
VAAGVVAHVAENADPEAVPAGAVVVARAATPRLSRVLRRASAMVTEVGAVAGHLATIAREYRIPALCGAPGALARLPEGQLVTVDAGACVVYRGLVEALLSLRAAGQELSPADPEYVTLRRLLGFIRPLSLTDPAAPEFSAAGCRTFHDIIHYCHERAVEELIAIQERHPELDGAAARRLDPAALGVPLDLSVLDLDGGVAPGAGERLTPADIRSRPLSALLAGLCRPEAWNRQPVSLGLRDILSGLGRAGGLAAAPEYAGRNLAIAARNHCNVSLRLGYHFNVIDSFLGEDPGQNYVYYRFVGGFADPVRRGRRVELIRRVLEARDFKVEVRGDLLTARFKIGTPAELSSVLARLGLLTGFTRQLDLSLTADGDVAALAAEFAALAEAAPMPGAGGEG